MKGFLQRILNKKLLLLIITILTLGSGTLIANAWGTCGGSSCGCTSSNSDAATNGTCAAPTTCWYVTAGYGGCRGHSWYQTASYYQYTSGSATCTTGATVVDVYGTYYACTKCSAQDYKETYSYRTVGALGHSYGAWESINSTTHKHTCSRCGHYETENHNLPANYVNSGQGYKYKSCSKCPYSDVIYYTLNLTLNANGGTINGQTTTSQSPKYNANATLPTPTRAGYTFKGWGYNANTYGVSFNAGSVTPVSINENLKNGDCSATLYAQWEKTVKYSINYMTSSGTPTSQSFYVVFRNHATSASVTSFTNGNYYYTDSLTSVVFSGNTSISSFNDGSTVTKNGYSDWKERGLAKSNSTSYASTLTSTMSVSINDVSASSGTIYYYNSYQRKPTITYVDYATNVKKSRTLTGSVTISGTAYDTAGMKYNGTVDRKPVFTFPTQNTMVYGEALSSGVKKNETWTSTGWSTDKTAKYKAYKSGTNLGMGTSYVSSSGTSKMASYGTYTYYGNYQKAVKLTYNPNGGTVNTSAVSYVRYANINSSTPTTTTKTYNAPNAYYKDSTSGLTIYTQESWTYVAPSSSNNYWINNEDYRDVISFNNTGTGYYSDNKTIWQYAPLVTETVYATWTNESKDVTVLKDAIWDNPKSDNINVDFEGLENIDINGIAKVTLTVTLNKANTQYVASNLQIEDYFNTAMWDFVDSSVSKGTLNRASDGTLLWTIGNVTVNKTTTITATYRLRLKEEYWTVDADGNKVTDYINYYINPMNAKGTYAKSVQRYLDSLEGTINSDGTYDVSKVSLDRDDMYYKESKNAHKSYVYVSYHYDTTESESGQQWTASDGYVDINLVNNKTNPEAKTQTLTFNFEDKVSGVNDPRITGDWINATKDNIQVTLVNKDTGKILFDYSKDSYSGNAIIKATYTVDSYVDAYTFDGSIIIDEMPYPQYVIINGSQYATITYTETDDGYVASIEEQTIITSNWVKVGDEYYKPLVHYFYMPTYAEVRNGENANVHYIVQLTAYKDSDTDFVHTVSIQLTMTNDNYGGSLKDLQTNIKDN